MWKKVSKYEMTKKDHEYQSKYAEEQSKRPSLHTSMHEDGKKWHENEASKLDDKDYSDEDVMVGDKKKNDKSK